MFPLWNHHQATFVYGPDIYENLIPENHILYKIDKEVDFSFVNEACKDLYSQDQGRPVEYFPETMFRSAIVQYLNDYSDREMEDGRLRKSDCSLSLISERYVKLSLHPAQASHNPLISGGSYHLDICLCNSSLQPINTKSVCKYLA